jgi:predicted RNase H-like HicB family nuclease
MKSIIVKAEWNNEDGIWIATSDDVPGLVTGAASLELLAAKIGPMIVDMIEMNKLEFNLAEIPVHIVAHQMERIVNPRAA